MPKERPPLLCAGVRARRPEPSGPRFVAPILCLACGARWTEAYHHPPLHFRCPACDRRQGVRDLEEPVIT